MLVEQQPLADQVRLPHLAVADRARSEVLRRPARGRGSDVRTVDRQSHGAHLRGDLSTAIAVSAAERESVLEGLDGDGHLRATGTILVLEGSEARYPLKLESLESFRRGAGNRRPRWLLLSVTPHSEQDPERAMVWVSDEARSAFLKLFEDYLERDTKGKGNPFNNALVANITRIKTAVLEDLWQSSESPRLHGKVWWELWLNPTADAVQVLRAYVELAGLQLSERVLKLPDRTVTWVRSEWNSLRGLPFTAVPVSEIRRPAFIDTVEDLRYDEQSELADDLLARVNAAPEDAPAVCHLDSGVLRTHVLLAASLADADNHTVLDDTADARNHGTRMAGLALFGDLDPLLLSIQPVLLQHRLESVKILPDISKPVHDPLTYGVVTAQAVALPETSNSRARVFCMPVTADADAAPGEPTLWSSSVDALAAGVDITRNGDTLELLSAPNHDATRLFVISAGNVQPGRHLTDGSDYLDTCDLSPVQDPAQAWNALTVGAHTDLTALPVDPSYEGWTSLAHGGALSPHSRTSQTFGRAWPIKPDICMEGGNVLIDGANDFHEAHPVLTVRTVDSRGDSRISSAHATSAATAQAARLAALTMARYPSYWPETVRALVVHSARWTPRMHADVAAAKTKNGKLAMLRRYGWGVPTESRVLDSTARGVTLVVQDEFTPFEGKAHQARRFRLHELPWPVAALADLGSARVSMRVTLSYFVEPNASRRGWSRKYSYASHGLRFELKAPTEAVGDFVARVNQAATDEEQGSTSVARSDRWLIGPNQRNVGSLHQDVWEDGTGPELASCGYLAVHPIGGWWKNNKRRDRQDRTVRYALIVSLSTEMQGVDLYTPIANELAVPVDALVPGT